MNTETLPLLEEKPAEKSGWPTSLLARLFFGVVFVAGLVFLVYSSHPEVATDREKAKRASQEQAVVDAEYATVQEEILARLISPGTAVFSPIEKVEIIPGGHKLSDRWEQDLWVGWVDSQNEYGALIRHEWKVAMSSALYWSHSDNELAGSASAHVLSLQPRR